MKIKIATLLLLSLVALVFSYSSEATVVEKVVLTESDFMYVNSVSEVSLPSSSSHTTLTDDDSPIIMSNLSESWLWGKEVDEEEYLVDLTINVKSQGSVSITFYMCYSVTSSFSPVSACLYYNHILSSYSEVNFNIGASFQESMQYGAFSVTFDGNLIYWGRGYMYQPSNFYQHEDKYIHTITLPASSSFMFHNTAELLFIYPELEDSWETDMACTNTDSIISISGACSFIEVGNHGLFISGITSDYIKTMYYMYYDVYYLASYGSEELYPHRLASSSLNWGYFFFSVDNGGQYTIGCNIDNGTYETTNSRVTRFEPVSFYYESSDFIYTNVLIEIDNLAGYVCQVTPDAFTITFQTTAVSLTEDPMYCENIYTVDSPDVMITQTLTVTEPNSEQQYTFVATCSKFRGTDLSFPIAIHRYGSTDSSGFFDVTQHGGAAVFTRLTASPNIVDIAPIIYSPTNMTDVGVMALQDEGVFGYQILERRVLTQKQMDGLTVPVTTYFRNITLRSMSLTVQQIKELLTGPGAGTRPEVLTKYCGVCSADTDLREQMLAKLTSLSGDSVFARVVVVGFKSEFMLGIYRSTLNQSDITGNDDVPWTQPGYVFPLAFVYSSVAGSNYHFDHVSVDAIVAPEDSTIGFNGLPVLTFSVSSNGTDTPTSFEVPISLFADEVAEFLYRGFESDSVPEDFDSLDYENSFYEEYHYSYTEMELQAADVAHYIPRILYAQSGAGSEVSSFPGGTILDSGDAPFLFAPERYNLVAQTFSVDREIDSNVQLMQRLQMVTGVYFFDVQTYYHSNNLLGGISEKELCLEGFYVTGESGSLLCQPVPEGKTVENNELVSCPEDFYCPKGNPGPMPTSIFGEIDYSPTHSFSALSLNESNTAEDMLLEVVTGRINPENLVFLMVLAIIVWALAEAVHPLRHLFKYFDFLSEEEDPGQISLAQIETQSQSPAPSLSEGALVAPPADSTSLPKGTSDGFYNVETFFNSPNNGPIDTHGGNMDSVTYMDVSDSSSDSSETKEKVMMGKWAFLLRHRRSATVVGGLFSVVLGFLLILMLSNAVVFFLSYDSEMAFEFSSYHSENDYGKNTVMSCQVLHSSSVSGERIALYDEVDEIKMNLFISVGSDVADSVVHNSLSYSFSGCSVGPLSCTSIIRSQILKEGGSLIEKFDNYVLVPISKIMATHSAVGSVFNPTIENEFAFEFRSTVHTSAVTLEMEVSTPYVDTFSFTMTTPETEDLSSLRAIEVNGAVYRSSVHESSGDVTRYVPIHQVSHYSATSRPRSQSDISQYPLEYVFSLSRSGNLTHCEVGPIASGVILLISFFLVSFSLIEIIKIAFESTAQVRTHVKAFLLRKRKEKTSVGGSMKPGELTEMTSLL